MPHYRVTDVDRQPLPAAVRNRHTSHLGYDADEQQRPFAHYLRSRTEPVQHHVHEALLRGRQPADFGYEVDEAPTKLAAPGHQAMESGWTRTSRGTLIVSCLTDMPGATAEMWDWWFGWHLRDSARYKLWHPEAHQRAVVGDDRSADRRLTDRERYVDNVSYVDEYVGAKKLRLAIRFVDPDTLGFANRPGTTYICGRIGVTYLPVAAGWVIHQVRPTEHGSEMRSRFFMGHGEILALPPAAVSLAAPAALLTSRVGNAVSRPFVGAVVRSTLSETLAHDLLFHCAGEMNHLAGFLPALWAEFREMP